MKTANRRWPSAKKIASYIIATVAKDYEAVGLEQGQAPLTPRRRLALLKIAAELAGIPNTPVARKALRQAVLS